MKRVIFGECLQGASHIRNNIECQDSYKKIEIDEHTAIIAVADGHGSASCPFSKTGSSIAVNVFCSVMQQYLEAYQDSEEQLLTFLNREGETKIARAIDDLWKERVLKNHTNNKREVPRLDDGNKDKLAIYKQYGSTLLGLLVTQSFYFIFQLGDGDIVYVDDNVTESILVTEKILGVETHSLSKEAAWKRAFSCVRRRELYCNLPQAIFISTDGFSNSYENEEEFLNTCSDYFSMIKEHGTKEVSKFLKSWLNETSELGSGDDITLIITYFASGEGKVESH